MAPGPPPSLSHCSAANEVGTTRLVIGRTRVRIPPVPLWGTVAQRKSTTSLRPLSLHLPSRPRKWGTSLVTRRWRVRFPPTALHAVVVQQKNTRLPASGSGCDSRPPLRSNAAGTTLVNASKEARRFEPSRERKLSKSLRPLSTSIDSSVRFSPPMPMRGSSSGEGSCLTSRLRRVRSSRPVPSANVAQSAEAAASNPAP